MPLRALGCSWAVLCRSFSPSSFLLIRMPYCCRCFCIRLGARASRLLAHVACSTRRVPLHVRPSCFDSWLLAFSAMPFSRSADRATFSIPILAIFWYLILKSSDAVKLNDVLCYSVTFLTTQGLRRSPGTGIPASGSCHSSFRTRA